MKKSNILISALILISFVLIMVLSGRPATPQEKVIEEAEKEITEKVIKDDATKYIEIIEIRDDVIYMEFNPDKLIEDDNKEIERIISENPEKDIIFTVGKGYVMQSVSAEEARRIDEEANAKQQAEFEAWYEEQKAAGKIDDYIEPPCATAKVQTPIDKPSRFIVCETEVIALPSKVSLPTDPVDPEEILESYLIELFSGISKKEREEGYTSMFSDPNAVNDVTFNNGNVVIDFNKRILSNIGGSESNIVITMLDQIYNTLFQFTEVKSVTLTLEGDCNAIGDVLLTGCLTYHTRHVGILSE